MPHAEDYTDSPFVIYCDKQGNWLIEDVSQFENIKASTDPFALQAKGTDFDRGSFAFVYDSVLKSRLWEEYRVVWKKWADDDDLRKSVGGIEAVAHFLDENMGEFSHEITDYLANLDKPLSTVSEIFPIAQQLAANKGDSEYNTDYAGEAILQVETVIKERITAEKLTQLKSELGENYLLEDIHEKEYGRKFEISELKNMLQNGTTTGRGGSRDYGEYDGDILWSLEVGDLRIDMRIWQHDQGNCGTFDNFVDFHIYADKGNNWEADRELYYNEAGFDISEINTEQDIEREMFRILDEYTQEMGLNCVPAEIFGNEVNFDLPDVSVSMLMQNSNKSNEQTQSQLSEKAEEMYSRLKSRSDYKFHSPNKSGLAQYTALVADGIKTENPDMNNSNSIDTFYVLEVGNLDIELCSFAKDNGEQYLGYYCCIKENGEWESHDEIYEKVNLDVTDLEKEMFRVLYNYTDEKGLQMNFEFEQAVKQIPNEVYKNIFADDKFYLSDNGHVERLYYNSDGHGGEGQYVSDNFNYSEIFNAATHAANSEDSVANFFEYLYDISRQYLTDNDGSENFYEEESRYHNDKYDFMGCSAETMEGLIAHAHSLEKSKEVSVNRDNQDNQDIQATHDKPEITAPKTSKGTLKHFIDTELGEHGNICVYNRYGDFLCEGKPKDLRTDKLWGLMDEWNSKISKSYLGTSQSGKRAINIHLSNYPVKERNFSKKLSAKVAESRQKTNRNQQKSKKREGDEL
jgi:hypothetical protein